MVRSIRVCMPLQNRCLVVFLSVWIESSRNRSTIVSCFFIENTIQWLSFCSFGVHKIWENALKRSFQWLLEKWAECVSNKTTIRSFVVVALLTLIFVSVVSVVAAVVSFETCVARVPRQSVTVCETKAFVSVVRVASRETMTTTKKKTMMRSWKMRKTHFPVTSAGVMRIAIHWCVGVFAEMCIEVKSWAMWLDCRRHSSDVCIE